MTRPHGPEPDAEFPAAWCEVLAPNPCDDAAGQRLAGRWPAVRRARAEGARRSRSWLAPLSAAVLLVLALAWIWPAPQQVSASTLLDTYGDAMRALPLEP